jgi:hypothetical protein
MLLVTNSCRALPGLLAGLVTCAGFGLSFWGAPAVEYSPVALSSVAISACESITVNVTVSATNALFDHGDEVVQVYVSAPQSSSFPVPRLALQVRRPALSVQAGPSRCPLPPRMFLGYVRHMRYVCMCTRACFDSRVFCVERVVPVRDSGLLPIDGVPWLGEPAVVPAGCVEVRWLPV